IAPPGPICRNGASGVSPDFDLAYGSTQSGGLDLGFNVEFVPVVRSYSDTEGYIESIPTIRFKPKLDSNGNRIVDEYWLAGNRGDLIEYQSNQLWPYFSDNANAPAPYKQGMESRILANPGKVWVVGNEADREQVQDSLLPETYARAYHDAYAYVKSVDPTAQIALGGLVNFAPDREQYLDLVFAEYQRIYGSKMPVDVFTMHVYNLWGRHFGSQTADAGGSSIALGTNPNLTWQTAIQNGIFSAELCDRDDVVCVDEHDDVDIFKSQIIRMRQWMKNNGYQERPLILREFGLNLTSDFCDINGERITAQRAADYLTSTITWMDSYTDSSIGYSLDDNRLVQRWAWFIIDQEIDVPAEADISHLITNYTINYPSCSSQDFPSKVPNPGNAYQLTVVGQAYRDVVATQNVNTPPFVDFVVDGIINGGAVLNSGETSTTSTIGVIVRNRGNSPTGQATNVVFRDASDNSLIGTYTIPANFQGCTTSIHRATVDWTHAAKGKFNFTVEIQSSEEQGSALTNNTSSGSAFVGNQALFLPVSGRR
ncbi:MAG: hypothetical protein AAGD96_09340, partial [Chloroflexota bacterium]